jgi:hypothetical protein
MLSLRSATYLLTAVTLLAVGCAETRTYNVSVRNDASRPITVGVVKEGGPYEPQWASPEDIAIGSPHADEYGWDAVVIPPGKTGGFNRPLEGKFDSNSRAVLRVYAGSMMLSQILATGPGSPNRLDLPLSPGANAFRVVDLRGGIDAKPLEAPETPETSYRVMDTPR